MFLITTKSLLPTGMGTYVLYRTSLTAPLHSVSYAQYGRSSPFLLCVSSALSFCLSHTASTT